MNAGAKQERRGIERRYEIMTRARLYPLLWKMALSAMAGMSVGTVYSMTDTYFVGKLGSDELTAAVGIVFTFISFLQALGFWFGYGSGNYISRQIGKKNYEEAGTMAASGFVLALAAGAALTVPGLLFLRPLSRLLGAGVSEGLMEAAGEYLRITLLSSPVMLAANVLYNQLRLQGAAKEAMLGMLAGMVINILLDPLFIINLGMGVSGAAFASLAGQSAGLALLWAFSRKNGNIRIDISKCRLDAFHLKEIAAGGAPNFCRQAITSLSGVLLNQAAGNIGSFPGGVSGEGAIAGMTVALRILAVAYALVIGFGQGFQPVCAINYGAGKYTRVRKAFGMSLATATGLLIAAAVPLYIYAGRLAGRFTDSPEAVSTAAAILRAQCFVLPLMGYYILIGMLLQNIGRFGAATTVTTAESGLFLVPAALLLPRLYGMEGLILCKPAASLCAAVFSLVLGTVCMKKYLPKRDKYPPERGME